MTSERRAPAAGRGAVAGVVVGLLVSGRPGPIEGAVRRGAMSTGHRAGRCTGLALSRSAEKGSSLLPGYLVPGAVAIVAVLSVTALGGCSEKTDGAAKPSRPQAPGQPAAPGSNGAAGASKVATVDPTKVIARADLQAAEKPRGHGGGRHRLADRCGEDHHLQLVLTPRFKSVAADEAVDIFERSLPAYLLDLDHLKRYDVVKGTNSSSSARTKSIRRPSTAHHGRGRGLRRSPGPTPRPSTCTSPTGGRSSRRCRSSDDRRARRGNGAPRPGRNRTADPEAVGASSGTPSRPGHRS